MTNRFSKDNQPDPKTRPTRGKNKRTLLLDAIRELIPEEMEGHDAEAFFYKLLVRQAAAGDSRIMKEVFARLHPVEKSVLPEYVINFPEEASPSEKIDHITKAIATGEVPADVGKLMVDIIAQGVRILEVTELMERLEKIEAILAGKEPGTDGS